MTRHLDERQLNDCADDTLESAESAAVQAHLLVCAACQERVSALRVLRARLASLPRDVAPPPHVLTGVHAHIATAPSSAHAAPARAQSIAAPVRGTMATWRVQPRLLAAAAVILIAVSSGTTALLMRPHRDEGVPAVTGDSTTPRTARLVGSSALEVAYEEAIAELQRAFERQQGTLAADTRRVLEINLAIIDRALAESRAALAADPANAALADMLRSGYERKLDVLRSATAHARARS